jgi:hypothetical protein
MIENIIIALSILFFFVQDGTAKAKYERLVKGRG